MIRRQKKGLFACLAFLFLATSCSDDISSGPATLKKSIHDIGLYPNALAQDNDYVYVVDSGNNTIDRLDKKTLQYSDAYIDLGQDAGPYDIHLDGEAIYIVNNMAANIVKTSKKSPMKHEIIASQEDGLIAPTSVTTGHDYIVIADSEYKYQNPQETGGKLLVIDNAGDKHHITLPHPNPTEVIHVDLERGNSDDHFAISASGVSQFEKDGSITPPASSCYVTIQVDEIQKLEPVIESQCVANNSLGRISVNKAYAFIGSATTPEIHRIKHGAKDYGSKIAVGPKGDTSMLIPLVLDERYVVVANFNNDAIMLYDTRYKGSEEMQQNAIKLRDETSIPSRKGPIHMVYDQSTSLLYVLNNLSNSIDILEIHLADSD